MFKCGICFKPAKFGTKGTSVILETREKTYPFRKDANVFIKEGKKETSDDLGGHGWEIVKEVRACQPCVAGMS